MAKVPPNITNHNTIILDTETTGLHKLFDKPFMCLIQIDNQNPVALHWSAELVDWLNKNLSVARRVICHNAKYDWHMLRNGGVDPDVLYNTNVHCTLVAETLIDEHKYSYSLDNLGVAYFGEGKTTEIYNTMAAYFGVKPDKTVMGRIAEFAASSNKNWQIVADYGIQDIVITKRLFDKQYPELVKQDLLPVFGLEMSTLKALVEMELRGVPVNTQQVAVVERELLVKQTQTQKAIFDLVGWEVNSRSPLQMEKAFISLGIPIPLSTKGKPTFAKDVLSGIDHPFMQLLQESRNIKTMLDTFIGGSIGKNLINGRIHTDFNQTRSEAGGTATGRLSSSGPNLQQIPKRDGELAPLIRGLFAAPEGYKFVANDWEQFEYRVFAHYVKDDELIARYINDPKTDFHSATAELTGKPRDKAKRINLGLVFGMGEGKLAKELGLPYTTEIRHGKECLIAGPEAQDLFNEYHSRFPKARSFLKEASHIAKTRGYVKTIMGRRLRFPNGEFVHKAGGLVFQGSSADIMKMKLVELNNEYRNTDVEFILVVHDEYLVMAPDHKVEAVAARVKEITEDVPQLRIPILADSGFGQNWWDAR